MPPDQPIGDALDVARGEAELWRAGLVLLLAALAAELLLAWLFTPKLVDADALVERAMRL